MKAIPQEFRAAYQEHEREITLSKTRLGCFLGIVMVPLFCGLDYYVYPQHVFSFFLSRLLCSALMAGLYPLLGTRFGRKHYHFMGVLLLFLPSATIAWMIYATDGAASPYYAGLTLVLMVLAVVLDWTFLQSVLSVLLVLMLYLLASLLHLLASRPPASGTSFGIFLNNLFFLVFPGIAIIVGAYFHSRSGQRVCLPLRIGQEPQGAGSESPPAQGKRDATGANRETGVARPHERRHHP